MSTIDPKPFDGESHIGKLTVADWKHIHETRRRLHEEYSFTPRDEEPTEDPAEEIMTSIGYVEVSTCCHSGGCEPFCQGVVTTHNETLEDAEEGGWPDERGCKVDLHMIAMDVSEYVVKENCEDIIKDNWEWIVRFEDVYLLDKNLGVHYCSAESQPQCWWVETRAILKDGCPDEIAQAIHEELQAWRDDESVCLMGWSSVDPYLTLPTGHEGDGRHAVVPIEWVFSTLEDLEGKELQDPISCDPQFMEEIISGHQQNCLL